MIHLNSEPHLPQSHNISYIWPIIWKAVQICCISYTVGVTCGSKRFICTSVLKVNVSDRLLRQNTLYRCRGGWILSDVGQRKTCRTTSAGRCLSTRHHLFRWSCERRRFSTRFPHSDILVMKCYNFQFAGLMPRVEHTPWRERNKVITRSWNTVTLRIPDGWFYSWMISLSPGIVLKDQLMN